MLERAIPAALAMVRWEVVYQLGRCTKEGEAKLNMRIADDLPPVCERKNAMKEMDNMARQSDILEKIIENDEFGKKSVSYKLTPTGWRIFKNINNIEKRPTRKHREVRGPNKIKPHNIPQQQSLDISPIYQSSVGVDTVMSAVDDLVKENASLRAAIISTMKIKLDSLNKLRDLLGYGPLVDSDKIEEEKEK